MKRSVSLKAPRYTSAQLLVWAWRDGSLGSRNIACRSATNRNGNELGPIPANQHSVLESIWDWSLLLRVLSVVVLTESVVDPIIVTVTIPDRWISFDVWSFSSRLRRVDLFTITRIGISKDIRIKKLIMETTSIFGKFSFDFDKSCLVCPEVSWGWRWEFAWLDPVALPLASVREQFKIIALIN